MHKGDNPFDALVIYTIYIYVCVCVCVRKHCCVSQGGHRRTDAYVLGIDQRRVLTVAEGSYMEVGGVLLFSRFIEVRMCREIYVTEFL